MMGGGSKFTTLNSFFTKQPLVAWPYDLGSPSFHHDFDLTLLVSIRHAHETQRAKKSVRTQVQDDSNGQPEQHSHNSAKEPSIRQKIFREMTQVLREDQDQRKNTGANRAATWKSSAPGGRNIADTAIFDRKCSKR